MDDESHFHGMQALYQFLLDYPIGEKRLQQHISFLLRNLDYDYESGRKAVCVPPYAQLSTLNS